MKKIAFVFMSAYLLLQASPSSAGDYEDGRTSYKAKEYDKAAAFYKKCADTGNVDCQRELAKIFSIFGKMDESYKYALKAAEKGDAFAQNQVGAALINGSGVKMNKAEGLKWVKKSAEQGDRTGIHHLAYLHDSSKFIGMQDLVEYNKDKAREFYVRAAEKGSYGAIVNLRMGIGPKDGKRVDATELTMWRFLTAAGSKNFLEDGGTQETLEKFRSAAIKELKDYVPVVLSQTSTGKYKVLTNGVEHDVDGFGDENGKTVEVGELIDNQKHNLAKGLQLAKQWAKDHPQANIGDIPTLKSLDLPRSNTFRKEMTAPKPKPEEPISLNDEKKPATPECKIKPVMTDAEINACGGNVHSQ